MMGVDIVRMRSSPPAVQPPQVPAPSVNADLEARIVAFYQEHAPSKLGTLGVATIATLYAAKEAKLWEKLQAKYPGAAGVGEVGGVAASGGGAASGGAASDENGASEGGSTDAREESISVTPPSRTTYTDETPRIHPLRESAQPAKRQRLTYEHEEMIELLCDTGEDHTFKLGEIEIGRSKPGTIELSLAHLKVSRVHAKLSRQDDGIYIADCDSKWGTFVAAKADDPDSAIGASLDRVDSTTSNGGIGPRDKWERVTKEGTKLYSGDSIAFGDCTDPKCCFTFIVKR
jgi:hypothetical protein